MTVIRLGNATIPPLAEILSRSKPDGFFWPAYEGYGGLRGFWVLGPLGTQLMNEVLKLWRKYFVLKNFGTTVEISAPIVTPEKVLEASGHLEHFTDPIVKCTKCGAVFRADELIEERLGVNAEGLTPNEIDELIRKNDIRCPRCGGEFSKVVLFNLLMGTVVGPFTEFERFNAYLRPETAQGMFVEFPYVYMSLGKRLPLGVAQIGRVARNEISPRQGMIRLREFTIAEIEFFFDPDKPDVPAELLSEVGDVEVRVLTKELQEKGSNEPRRYAVNDLIKEGVVKTPWMAYWLGISWLFVRELGVPEDEMYYLEKYGNALAHYSVQTFDQMVRIPGYGWLEVAGHSYRTDYDLRGHLSKAVNRSFFEQALTASGKIPHVVEPSFGAERLGLAAYTWAYSRGLSRGKNILVFPVSIAPIKASVIPLLSSDERMVIKAKQIKNKLSILGIPTLLITGKRIGKAYRRSDRLGIPYAITVDQQTLEDDTITVRSRDTSKQIRLGLNEVVKGFTDILVNGVTEVFPELLL
jgi:glycyl-tRNA synthetase (class II)